MRSAVIGEIAPQQTQLARLLIETQDRQFEAMKPGAIAVALDALARKVIPRGIAAWLPHITGYSLSCYPLYTPRTIDFSRIFLPTVDRTLEEGMVFHM
jgi:Xaa-Pro dipeptidase